MRTRGTAASVARQGAVAGLAPLFERPANERRWARGFGSLSRLKRRVLELCRREQGCTIDEAARELDLKCACVRGRFGDLENAGIIGRAAITRKTRRGKDADVYKALK